MIARRPLRAVLRTQYRLAERSDLRDSRDTQTTHPSPSTTDTYSRRQVRAPERLSHRPGGCLLTHHAHGLQGRQQAEEDGQPHRGRQHRTGCEDQSHERKSEPIAPFTPQQETALRSRSSAKRPNTQHQQCVYRNRSSLVPDQNSATSPSRGDTSTASLARSS